MREALLRAILEDPADDLPRLAYADWLEENGDSNDRVHAAFVRAQLEMAKVVDQQCDQCRAHGRGGQHTNGPCRCGPEFKARRSEAIHQANDMLDASTATQIRRTLARVAWAQQGLGRKVHVVSHIFRRGWIDKVSCSLAEFMADGFVAELFANHPITEVKLLEKCPERVERDPGDPLWTFFRSEILDDRPHHLPLALLNWTAATYFPTEDAASAALSRACVAYGRQQAGLPQLKGA